MPENPHFKLSKYHRIELGFFVLYFLIFPLLTNLEYNLWEKHKYGITSKDFEFSVVYGITSAIAFWGFYKTLQYCLENSRLKTFIFSVLLFLVAYHFYEKGIYLLVAHLDFLSISIRSEALRIYKLDTLAYALIYMFREFLTIGSLVYFIHSTKQKEQMKILREQQLVSELTYLKAQLQPHFFFNTLNNIYALAIRQSADTAPLVAKLAEMMRYILYKSEKEVVTLKEEVGFLQNYIAVESVRYRSVIDISFDAQGIDNESKISPLLLLPFIENSFKHGIQEETEKGFVHIVICKTENELILQISNSIAVTKSNHTIQESAYADLSCVNIGSKADRIASAVAHTDSKPGNTGLNFDHTRSIFNNTDSSSRNTESTFNHMQSIFDQTGSRNDHTNSTAGNTISDSTGGIGLVNVKKRLELLYPGKYKLHHETDGSTYQVNLILNMK